MSLEPEPPEELLSVSALTHQIKALLERSVGEFWIRGEISNLRRQASGHLYFTLKDDGAQISAVMFRGDASRISGQISDGMEAIIYGGLSVYPPRGNYQIVVRILQPGGEGVLRQRFEALKAKLAAEGLFDRERKQLIPKLPARLAVITSATGAALKDFVSILQRREWRGHVRILPVRVQGKEAALEIVAMIEKANAENLGDVIILTRGGGSLEDLWPFNEEAVARSIAASSLPIISAVGHEIDYSLSDFAADQRAETPSAAAELLTSNFVEFHESIDTFRQRLRRLVDQRLKFEAERIERMKITLERQTPQHRIEQAWLKLDDLRTQLAQKGVAKLQASRLELAKKHLSLSKHSPELPIKHARQLLGQLASRLTQSSPEAPLRRGYVLVRDRKQNLITRRAHLPKNAKLELEWIDGTLRLDPKKKEVAEQTGLALED
mgnify:CR=1 FL=1|jgi:exodeoxyribonuclease VII large subunit|tara:strand:+ start:7426 stop:8739 length:1314 start_codon:yes stop_codon:yes gene_type:complete